ncbi:type II toxin-antitoxin system RelE/ParE family toxin [Pseudoduganella sp. FT93W]|uniref:Type II toxin-antitoxin system RelE/ParE family toxin n=1 Tax=Duganella fentianensis TaxID=2692177 RepID=A0A845I0T2_9BURK|nr:type II toxin-antitoxin system RelE/ParE family toxin [Duganella fentianensis]MYN44328.1 type II toxin-antitoxin system RelE/ParE family toxin [Duganella fentianensis]
MHDKPIVWIGTSLKDLTDDTLFPAEARWYAGVQLRKIQRGYEPDSWKPFENLGAGVREIRIRLPDGAFRVMFVAKFAEAVYVLHSFKKKTQKTSAHDMEITRQRYKAVIRVRSTL